MEESPAGNTAASGAVRIAMYDPVSSQKEEAFHYAAFLIGVLVVASGVFVGLSLYERSELDEYRLGIGMEEISRMQRVFDIETPTVFAGNQQQEMNLHNMHSILFGNAHKLAMVFGLIVLPFLVETAPKNALLGALRDFLPGRFVLMVSGPFIAFNYNGWNMFLTPFTVAVTVLIFHYYARAARDRGDRGEARFFRLLALFVVVAQGLFLALGERFVRTWDTSEYGELFMAIGLALFSWEATRRLVARYPARKTRLGAVPAAP